MNKTKMTLAATGGVIGVAVLVMAYFVWSAYSDKTAAIEGDDEGTDGLETVVAEAGKLSRSPIYPCLASVKAIESNTAAIVAWKDEAAKLAARGDRPVRKTTTAQFKNDMLEEAKRLSALPGSAGGKLVKPDFAFGPFKPYVAEGKMPAEAELAKLVRQWDDLVKIIETLAANGIGELLDVQFKGAASAEQQEEAAQPKKRGKQRVRRNVEKAAEPEAKADSFGYVVTFSTRAPGLVKAVNALTVNERFIVIDDLTFVREKDVIAEALGGDEKKAEAQSTGGRRRRRHAFAEEEKKDEVAAADAGKNGIITDPLLDAPMKVELTLTVYDFGSMKEEKAEEKKGEEK